MTFSIVARCPRTGMLGVAVSSKALASGAWVPYVRAGVGAIASQAFVNPYLGIDCLELLAQGLPASRALERVIESDRGRELRQVAAVDADGHTAAFAGGGCIDWAGYVEGGGYACSGNILVGENVVKEMARAFEGSVEEELPERLLQALEAGQEAGGDRRGRQSAGIVVAGTEAYPVCDLRVDDHPEPIEELRRVFALYQENAPILEQLLSSRRDDFAPNLETMLRIRDALAESLEEETATAKER